MFVIRFSHRGVSAVVTFGDAVEIYCIRGIIVIIALYAHWVNAWVMIFKLSLNVPCPYTQAYRRKGIYSSP